MFAKDAPSAREEISYFKKQIINSQRSGNCEQSYI